MESEIDEVGRKLSILREQNLDRVHIDIGDGLFSDLLSIAPADLQQFDLSKFKMDIHLLVDDPTEWIEESVALKPARLIAQIEHMGSQLAYLENVEGYGIEGGLALKIETPIEEIEPESLEEAKTILFLAIPPGTTGSPFDERVISKIKALRAKYKGSILIDGAMNPETYERVIKAGASEAGANSAYWRGDFNG
jgi:pentose-5-phosphate-3-epimerase